MPPTRLWGGVRPAPHRLWRKRLPPNTHHREVHQTERSGGAAAARKRKPKSLDLTVPTRSPKVPQKDRQDPLHRSAGHAHQSSSLPATQARPHPCALT